MKPTPPNQFRQRRGDRFDSTDACGNNGVFVVPFTQFGHRVLACCIVSDGTAPSGETIPEPFRGWEHVSVHCRDYSMERNPRLPTWGEMCAVKDLFWNDDEWVIQYHPAKSDYVNHAAYVLHLWKPPVEIPKPPMICV